MIACEVAELHGCRVGCGRGLGVEVATGRLERGSSALAAEMVEVGARAVKSENTCMGQIFLSTIFSAK